VNLPRPRTGKAMRRASRSRGVSPVPGGNACLVDVCRSDSRACRTVLRTREAVDPRFFSNLTVDGKSGPADYSHLEIAGHTGAVKGLARKEMGRLDGTALPMVNTETEYGVQSKVRLRLPVFTGTLGSTATARANWEHIAAGAAVSGITILCGSNLCGLDPELELHADGRVRKSPDMACRVEQYRRHHEGYGDMVVQMNVEDIRLGVPEYVIDRLGIECIEFKWGRDSGCLDDQTRVDSLNQALELQRRGYLVTPDPSDPASQAAFKTGVLGHFERHVRWGVIDQDRFVNEVQRVRTLGAKRIALRTGAYPMCELATAIQWASDAGLDLVIMDGVPSGIGPSPWRTAEGWGVPLFHLQSMTYDLCRKLAARGRFVPDIVVAGGFNSADHLFKILAMGAPYTKAVCMGRTWMMPDIVGRNMGSCLRQGPVALPEAFNSFGITAQETIACYDELAARYGKETAGKLPLGAVGLYAYCSKTKIGLQRLMAGSRNSQVSAISRDDIVTLTPEATRVSGLACIMDACGEKAKAITG